MCADSPARPTWMVLQEAVAHRRVLRAEDPRSAAEIAIRARIDLGHAKTPRQLRFDEISLRKSVARPWHATVDRTSSRSVIQEVRQQVRPYRSSPSPLPVRVRASDAPTLRSPVGFSSGTAPHPPHIAVIER
jgi:hypothetical protein